MKKSLRLLMTLSLFSLNGSYGMKTTVTLNEHTSINLLSRVFFAADSSKEQFEVFFKNFCINQSFQKKRITFPLKLIRVEDNRESTKYIPANKWKYTNFLKLKKNKNILRVLPITKNKVNVQFSIQDTGVLVNHIFEYKNDRWRLICIRDESD